MARVVFLGTPEAALPTLRLLDEHHDVGLVVTQPDRPKGRSRRPAPPPVKDLADALGLTVSQPSNRTELRAAIGDRGRFDVGVVVAYGRVLGPEILDAPTSGVLNVHFSLLPRWRGAAPVARALMADDRMTGVTIIKLDEGLDTGPVLTAQAIDIPGGLNAGELTELLADLGGRLLIDVLPRYLVGELVPIPQSDEGASYAAKIESSDRSIDPGTSAAAVVARIRALAPSPAATLEIDGEVHKILEAGIGNTRVRPGTWAKIDGRPLVGLADAAIELVTLQPPGKNPQSGIAWVNGRHRDSGIIG